MAFKMKGFPLHSGTSPAKQYKSDAQRKAIYASKAERSAAKQKSANLKTLDELIEEGFTPADARRMQKDKAVTGVQKETDKQKMQRLEDEAAKANKAGDTEKAKKLMAQVSKLEDKIQGTTKPPTKQTEKQRKKLHPNLVKEIEKANKMENRPDPTYEGTDEFRKEKDIPKKEFKKRGVKKPPTKQRVEMKKTAEMPQMLTKTIEEQLPTLIAVPPKETLMPLPPPPTQVINPRGPGKIGPGRRSKVGKKLTKVANIFRKKGNKRSPDFK